MGCAEWVNGPASRTFSGSTWDVVKMLLGEFLGTAILCFLGLSTCLNWTNVPPNVVQVALGFGLAIAGIIYMLGPISGAHINPSITIASMISGRINATKGFLYILFQCLGAIAGSGALYCIQVDPHINHTSFGLTLPHPRMAATQALAAEVLLTMIFVLVFLSVTDVNWSYVKGSASLAIGFTATACILGHATSTGTSLNPARSLGPAVIMNHYHSLWIYWIGPLTGSALAAFLYKILIYVPKEPEVPKVIIDEFTETPGDGDVNNYDPYLDFDEIVIDDGPPVRAAPVTQAGQTQTTPAQQNQFSPGGQPQQVPQSQFAPTGRGQPGPAQQFQPQAQGPPQSPQFSPRGSGQFQPQGQSPFQAQQSGQPMTRKLSK